MSWWLLLAAVTIMGVSSILAGQDFVIPSGKVWLQSADGRVSYTGPSGTASR